MTPLTPANLAAIERRAAAATEALARPAGALYVEQSLSAADVPALLRHIAALQAQHAGEVAAAEDALTTAREERDAARSALDELVAAVRVEREAVAHLTRARHRSARAWDDGADAENEARQAHYEADDAMREATERLDALLSAAPPPATVPAALVRYPLRSDAAVPRISTPWPTKSATPSRCRRTSSGWACRGTPCCAPAPTARCIRAWWTASMEPR